jgi:uncharacterized repeat protein (TIGR01451 family)
LTTRGISFYNTEVQGTSVRAQNRTNFTAMDAMGGALGGGVRTIGTHAMNTRSTFTTNGANWDFSSIWTNGLFHGTPAYIDTFPYFLAGIVLASRPPIVRAISLGDTTITGIGHSPEAQIYVELPNGTYLEATTGRNLEWSVDLPRGMALNPGDEIVAVQQEPGLPESDEAVAVVRIDRPIDITAEIEFENVSSTNGLNAVGDVIRYRVTISNHGDEDERADRIQIFDSLPPGMVYAEGTARQITENDDGDQVATSIQRNTSNVSSRGHSYDASNRRLEIRLGDLRLHGGESVVVEFDVRIEAGARNTELGSKTLSIVANRVSRTSAHNITTAMLVQDGFRIEN